MLTGLLFCMTHFFFLHLLYSKALPQFGSLLLWRWRQYFPLEYWKTLHQPGGVHFVTVTCEFSFGHYSHKTEFGLLCVKTHV
jgi:hypothetical protein